MPLTVNDVIEMMAAEAAQTGGDLELTLNVYGRLLAVAQGESASGAERFKAAKAADA